ncbi:hypothetical protein [uncultured Aquincola sp.]|uniref:mechanosensitive ion channel family protein n=1 Tax=uncultured Aquincola sp. TaxID=886556 RepID=UPI0032B29716
MERVDMMLEPLRAFLLQIGAFIPRLLIAAGVLIVGVLVAKAARFAVRKTLRAINFHIVTRRAGVDGLLQRGGSETDTTDLLAWLAYWVVILAALIVAFNGLGLTQVTELLGRVMVFVPKVIVGLLILAFGAYFARFVANAVATYCHSVGVRDADLLGGLARYAILIFVLMIALDHLDIGGAIVRYSFLIVLGGLVAAIALAFGLGGREWAAAHLERWWPSKGLDAVPPRGARSPGGPGAQVTPFNPGAPGAASGAAGAGMGAGGLGTGTAGPGGPGSPGRMGGGARRDG